MAKLSRLLRYVPLEDLLYELEKRSWIPILVQSRETANLMWEAGKSDAEKFTIYQG